MAVRIENLAEPIPGYRLVERLGGGGFGEVWKAEAPGGLFKAIKFVFGDLKGAGEDGQRAEQELKALSRVKTVRHPYVLSLERYDIIDGQLIIVMELADRNLWDRYKECRAQGLPGIPREELLRYMEETAEALDLMNKEYQLQHLDIKPQNLFLVHQHIKVADFGLVKDLEGTQASVTGGVTPVYAAPETFDGYVSRFSDQYSLAIVYQELLTGQRPFVGSNVRQLIVQHLQAPPNLASLPPEDRPVIGRSLSKLPDHRFPSCREMVEHLRRNDGAPAQNGHAVPAPAPVPAAELSGIISDTHSAPTASLRQRSEDSAPGTTHFLRAQEGAILKDGVPGRPKAPPEVVGDGCLLPALVIGVGQLALTVLQRLRESLTERFGGLDRLPQLRLLLLDTDPEVVRGAGRLGHGAALSAGEVVLAQLNRPSYYLKQREDRPALESWLNPRMLYRIPRSQVTTGVRALGRLAFTDNYRAIARRLQAELQDIQDVHAVQSAARRTGAGLRTNRPRVYVITSLAGGTGSGMFLDLAYTLRALLKQAGYEQPDVTGVLLLPPVDRSRTRTLALGNAYAALTELAHYGSPASRFSGHYHEREAAVEDSDPPFSRTLLLPLPEETDEIATRELVDLAGQFLARDLGSPLGRAADLSRAGLEAPPWQSRGLYYQTFGLFTLSWPRQTVLTSVASILCQRLVQRWASKDSKPIRDDVQAWVQEQWAAQALGADHFIERLQAECASTLGRDPEAVFQATVESLGARFAGAANRKGGPAPDLAPEEVADVLRQLEEFVGRPLDETSTDEPALLMKAVHEGSDTLTAEWGQKLAELSVRLIEEPAYRLAGAEEAVRQSVASLEQALQGQETLCHEIAARTADAYARIQQFLLGGKGGGRRTSAPAEIVELLRHYPKWRLQSLILHQVTAAFVSLRGHLSDELREINFCRVRLTELNRQLQESAAKIVDPAGQPGVGRQLYPAGCKTLAEAIEHFLAGVSSDTLLELDTRAQAAINSQFTALVHVCLTSANILKDVEVALIATAVDFAGALLPKTDVAEMFLERNPDEQAAKSEIADYYAEAAPEIMPGREVRPPAALCVLATPAGPAGERFRTLVAKALPEVEMQHAIGGDDIVLYRELSNVPLSEVEQLGPVALDAYRQLTAADHFTPHTRIDVDFARK
jgi:serine/threonine protein kinase